MDAALRRMFSRLGILVHLGLCGVGQIGLRYVGLGVAHPRRIVVCTFPLRALRESLFMRRYLQCQGWALSRWRASRSW